MPEIISYFSFEFYKVRHTAFLADNRRWYVRLDHLCEQMGLNVEGQRRRIQGRKAIAEYYVTMVTDTDYKGTLRKQEVGFVDLEILPYWLGMIEENKLKAEIRDRIVLYQRDFVRTAWAAYRSEMFSPDLIAEMDTHLPPQERAMYELMGEFQTLRRKVELVSGKLDEELARFGLKLADFDNRFQAMESKVIGEANIYPEQALMIGEMIKAVGTAMYEAHRAKSKSEAYMNAQSDFKREFGVHLYTALPQKRLDEAVQFLARRWQHLKPGQPLPNIFEGHQPSLLK